MYRARRNGYLYDRQDEEQRGLDWADSMTFGSLTFSSQRLALFLRAIIAQPDIVILDEAFGGMDDVMRDKCMFFLTHGETRMQSPYYMNHMVLAKTKLGNRPRKPGRIGRLALTITEGLTPNQALIVVSHVAAEIPAPVNNFLYLPDRTSESTSGDDGGLRCVTGESRGIQLARDPGLWEAIWDIPKHPIRDFAPPTVNQFAVTLKRLRKFILASKVAIQDWTEQLARIRRYIDDQYPTPHHMRILAKARAQTAQEKFEQSRRRRVIFDRRIHATLSRHVASFDQKLRNYDVRIAKINRRIAMWPGKIERAREEQKLREEKGGRSKTPFDREHLQRQRKEGPLLERQLAQRAAIVRKREATLGRLAVVEKRQAEMAEEGWDVDVPDESESRRPYGIYPPKKQSM